MERGEAPAPEAPFSSCRQVVKRRGSSLQHWRPLFRPPSCQPTLVQVPGAPPVLSGSCEQLVEG
eukprot:1100510-Alexandrium_andersonii.AAC.1